jgi:hypothetical protein
MTRFVRKFCAKRSVLVFVIFGTLIVLLARDLELTPVAVDRSAFPANNTSSERLSEK